MKFECHITTLTEFSETATRIAQEFHWKTSEIARDPLLGNATYFYLTSHGDTFDRMKHRMDACVSELKAAGVRVIREKIEEIVHDTKLGLVGPGAQALELARLQAVNAQMATVLTLYLRIRNDSQAPASFKMLDGEAEAALRAHAGE